MLCFSSIDHDGLSANFEDNYTNKYVNNHFPHECATMQALLPLMFLFCWLILTKIDVAKWKFKAHNPIRNSINNCPPASYADVYITCFLQPICKTIDSVPHIPLLENLHAFELNQHILQWINFYLCNRKQYVVVNGVSLGSIHSYNIWCVQGSALGLFLVYINCVIRISNCWIPATVFGEIFQCQFFE